MAASLSANEKEELQSNPLLQDFEFPPYDIVEAKHVRPAIRTILKKLEIDLERLEHTVEPSWPKLVAPYEKIRDQLDVPWKIISHLDAVKLTTELRAAIEVVRPEIVKFELRLAQSKPIFNAFKDLRGSPDWQSFSEARKRIVNGEIKSAILSGVALDDDSKEKFNKIKHKLEKLSQKFAENMFAAHEEFEKLVTDKKAIEGLPATTLSLAAQRAVSKGHTGSTAENGPWIITFDDLSYYSLIHHVHSDEFRKKIFRAILTLASSGDLDNTHIVDQILKLRLEAAKLLGCSNHAEVSMATKMATVVKVVEFLENLRSASWNAAVQDMEEIKRFSKDQGASELNDLTHLDIRFWSARIFHSKFTINEEELQPYFSLPNVLGGLFNLTKTLFAINIDAADGSAPVWNSDVRFYCVKDHLGNPIAYFYLDSYSRPAEKKGGAWMTEVVSRSRALSRDGVTVRLPIANIVFNLTPPVGNKPSLMTFDEVQTIFHEFGHALLHMLTKQDESLVSGARGIELDAKDLSSTFMMNWCYHRDTFMSIAKHYETGETLPEAVYHNLLAARSHCTGLAILNQLKLAYVDLELHSKYVPGGSESIHDVYQRIFERTQVYPPFPEERFLCVFYHAFAFHTGSYAAGYYSYLWAEAMSADAFSAFEDAGLDDIKAMKEIGNKFRETVLALGGGKHPLEVFAAFRGRDPSLEALLRHKGLLAASE